MYIKNIEIKNLHNVTSKSYDFDGSTYLIGKNGAGKSTVLQAIQFALLGYFPGYDKTKSSILSHSKDGSGFSVQLTFDNGETLKREVIKRQSSTDMVLTPDTIDVDEIIGNLELPIFNFNELLNSTANKQKEWFVDNLPGSSVPIDWKEVFGNSEYAEEIISCSDRFRRDSYTVSQIADISDYLKDELSYKKGELSRIESTIKTLIYYDDFEVSEDIEVLKARYKELTAKRDRQVEINSKIAHKQELKKQLESLNYPFCGSVDEDESLIENRTEQAAIMEQIQKLSEDIKSAENKVHEYTLAAEKLKSVIDGKGVCPYTHETCESISGMLADYVAQYADVIDKFGNEKEAYRIANDSYSALSEQLALLQTRELAIKQLYDKRDMLVQSIGEDSDLVPEDISATDKEQSEIFSKIQRATANEQFESQNEILTKDKIDVETKCNQLKEWIKLTGANGNLQNDIVKTPFVNLGVKMSSIIQQIFREPVVCEFVVESKANSFSFGIKRHGSYIPYEKLSSGEKCLFLFAMMTCIVEMSTAKIKIILVDDLLDHLDDENAERLFDYISNQDKIQVIFAGVKPCDKLNVIHIGDA